jgi:hypothetical protein
MTSSFPEWMEPMAATLTQDRFTGADWIFERKLDGIRMLAFKKGNDVKLYSRNHLLQHYPAVAEAIGELPVHDTILDGEVVSSPLPAGDGRSNELVLDLGNGARIRYAHMNIEILPDANSVAMRAAEFVATCNHQPRSGDSPQGHSSLSTHRGSQTA